MKASVVAIDGTPLELPSTFSRRVSELSDATTELASASASVVKKFVAPHGWAVFTVEFLIDSAVAIAISATCAALFSGMASTVIALLALALWIGARLIGPLRTDVVLPVVQAVTSDVTSRVSAWKARRAAVAKSAV